jgi:hypothetical protein
MARYGKVSTQVWNDAKFRDLSDDAQLVWFMLLTHPWQTSVGAFRATLPGLAAEKGWSTGRFEAAFDEIRGAGMAEVDREASLVALPNFMRHNMPENPNVVKGYAKALDLLPECSLRRAHVERSISAIRGSIEQRAPKDPQPWLVALEALEKGSRKGFPNPSGRVCEPVAVAVAVPGAVPDAVAVPDDEGETASRNRSGCSDSSPNGGELSRVFDHYLAHRPDWGRQGHAGGKRLIVARLRDGAPPDELCRAIDDGFARAAHLSVTDRKKRTTLGYIFDHDDRVQEILYGDWGLDDEAGAEALP